jgi:hypothetical protein
MDDGIRLESAQDVTNELVLAQVPEKIGKSLARDFLPGPYAIPEGADRDERPGVERELPPTLGKVVKDCNVVAPRRKVDRRRPSQIAIPTQNQHFHLSSPPLEESTRYQEECCGDLRLSLAVFPP